MLLKIARLRPSALSFKSSNYPAIMTITKLLAPLCSDDTAEDAGALLGRTLAELPHTHHAAKLYIAAVLAAFALRLCMILACGLVQAVIGDTLAKDLSYVLCVVVGMAGHHLLNVRKARDVGDESIAFAKMCQNSILWLVF
mmetsp:Transcript_20632/g.54722  ORF Transcript_20632/g.54722 Transcript_20632/m.54722 type:complete len:141 (+) Transcript_20632:85-507(+)